MDIKVEFTMLLSEHSISASQLIVGSLPGKISITRQEYYANLHNRFWTVTAGIFGENVPEDYESKEDLLRRHGIALWVYTDTRNAKAAWTQRSVQVNTMT